MRERAPIQITNRENQQPLGEFVPQDFPELWGGVRVHGLSYLNKVASAELQNLFLPPIIRGASTNEGLAEAEIGHFSDRYPELRIELESDDAFLDFKARVEEGKAGEPKLLDVSDYEAHWPTQHGTQAFYRNLEYQLGHMGVPIIIGQKLPTSLGYFMHRVGQVPVGLLRPEFARVQELVSELYSRDSRQYLAELSSFAFTVQLYGKSPRDMVDPRFVPQLTELQAIFDRMNLVERQADYPTEVMRVFGLRP